MTNRPLDGRARVFIYGSCVSRDTVAHAPSQFSVLRYVARQSLISAFAGPAPTPDISALASAFQRRMVTGDAAGNLATLLDQDAFATDLVLWDLTDERLGVLRSPRGAVVTKSLELVTTRIIESMGEWKLIEFGSDEHYSLWTAGAMQLAERLDALGLLARSALLVAPWAEATDDGSPVPMSFGVSSAVANKTYERYHAFAERQLGITTVRLAREDAIAAVNHRWGPAPFHYAAHTYDVIVRNLAKLWPPPPGSTP